MSHDGAHRHQRERSTVAATTARVIKRAGAGGGRHLFAGVRRHWVDVAVITKETRAYIDAGAQVNAKRDVKVEAISGEEVMSITGSGGVGKSVGIAGSVGVSVYTLTTEAFIEGNKTVNNVALSGAKVNADGSVKVAAEDRTEIDMIAGTIAGGQSAGIGAAIGVPIVTKTTRAFIKPTPRWPASASRRRHRQARRIQNHDPRPAGRAGWRIRQVPP